MLCIVRGVLLEDKASSEVYTILFGGSVRGVEERGSARHQPKSGPATEDPDEHFKRRVAQSDELRTLVSGLEKLIGLRKKPAKLLTQQRD